MRLLRSLGCLQYRCSRMPALKASTRVCWPSEAITWAMEIPVERSADPGVRARNESCECNHGRHEGCRDQCDDDGNVDVADLEAKAQQHADELAAVMVTYPSTHGVFENEIRRICEVVHQAGGQVYLDGANLNARLVSAGQVTTVQTSFT